MRMADLSLKTIKKAHAEDIEAYKYSGRSSPQHMHRHWLLLHIKKLEQQIEAAEAAITELAASTDTYYIEIGHYSVPAHEVYEDKYTSEVKDERM